jgi:uncharacterized protein (TIGR02594 family)
MVVSSALRRSLVALAMCSAAIAVSSSSASARISHHGTTRYVHARHVAHDARHYVHYRHYRTAARAWRRERSIAKLREPRFARVQASVMSGATQGATTMASTSASFGGGSDLVSEARRYLGGNPTGRGSLWCARFMNMVLQHTGHRGIGSDMANSFASYGQRVSGPQVGAIAVMGRRGGAHVGIITGVDARGNPIMISGNNGNRVREAPISRGRIYAYVMPN